MSLLWLRRVGMLQRQRCPDIFWKSFNPAVIFSELQVGIHDRMVASWIQFRALHSLLFVLRPSAHVWDLIQDLRMGLHFRPAFCGWHLDKLNLPLRARGLIRLKFSCLNNWFRWTHTLRCGCFFRLLGVWLAIRLWWRSCWFLSLLVSGPSCNSSIHTF